MIMLFTISHHFCCTKTLELSGIRPNPGEDCILNECSDDGVTGDVSSSPGTP